MNTALQKKFLESNLLTSVFRRLQNIADKNLESIPWASGSDIARIFLWEDPSLKCIGAGKTAAVFLTPDGNHCLRVSNAEIDGLALVLQEDGLTEHKHSAMYLPLAANPVYNIFYTPRYFQLTVNERLESIKLPSVLGYLKFLQEYAFSKGCLIDAAVFTGHHLMGASTGEIKVIDPFIRRISWT